MTDLKKKVKPRCVNETQISLKDLDPLSQNYLPTSRKEVLHHCLPRQILSNQVTFFPLMETRPCAAFLTKIAMYCEHAAAVMIKLQNCPCVTHSSNHKHVI